MTFNTTVKPHGIKLMKFAYILILVLMFAAAAYSQTNQAAGSAAENFSALTINGADFELGKLRGKVVVLTFWSTKCPICQAEIPRLNLLVGKFNASGVVFAAPTTNDTAMVTRFLKNNSFDFIILPDCFDAVMKYAEKDSEGNLMMGFPAYFVIDQDGRVSLKASGSGKTELIAGEINRLLSIAKNVSPSTRID